MKRRLLITGGCGFIGTNIADYFSEREWTVTVLDNLSRRGAIENLHWLKEKHPAISFVHADIRTDLEAVSRAIVETDAIFHLASQVAVTTSWQNPREDFEINAVGTLNILEAIRRQGVNPSLLYASTNKVYGGMEDIEVTLQNNRYYYKDLPLGIPESRLLDFHSPYGCSKGTSDQYIRDYARMYGLNTVVLRQSCIYGPRQYGITDQGWVAWFMVAACGQEPLTIYGDGKQTRDVLYVTDLARAYEAALNRLPEIKGQIFNIGGGARNVLSVLELIEYLEQRLNRNIDYKRADWRPGDQPCYISDIRKTEQILEWQPQVDTPEGLDLLLNWVQNHLEEFRQLGILQKVTVATPAQKIKA
jgi:CDP-paratose 2-epimerase